MGCGQGHPGTKYDYGAMSAVCWLLQHFLQQTSTIALWAIQILGGDSVQTSPLIHSRQNNQARAQTRQCWGSIWHHIRAVSLQDISHALPQQNDQAWTQTGHWQPSRSSWHRIWGQTMMTRATLSESDLIIQLFTLCYPNIPDNNPRKKKQV